MGIRGLAGFLKYKFPTLRRQLHWVGWAGTCWGVDIASILYKAKGAGLDPLTVLASLFVRVRRAGIEPLVVFDGRTPAAKSAVVEKRRVIRLEVEKEITQIRVELAKGDELAEIERAELEVREAELKKKAPKVNREDRDDVKQFLYACGIQFVTAAEEADDLLGYLCRTGHLHAVISADMDMLARGVPTLIVPESPDTTVMTILHTAEVLGHLGLSPDQFTAACTLMGSDYTPQGFRGYEARVACDMVRKGVDLDALGLVEALHKLSGEGVTWESLLSDKQQEKWALGIPPKEVANLQRYCVEKGWPQDWFAALYLGV